MSEAAQTAEQPKFEQWAIVELMGHRQVAGRVSEQNIAGHVLLRIDVPECPAIEAREVRRPWGEKVVIPAQPVIPSYTQFYNATSIYCLTPTTEEIAVQVTLQKRERPVALFGVSAARDVEMPSLPASLDEFQDQEIEE